MKLLLKSLLFSYLDSAALGLKKTSSTPSKIAKLIPPDHHHLPRQDKRHLFLQGGAIDKSTVADIGAVIGGFYGGLVAIAPRKETEMYCTDVPAAANPVTEFIAVRSSTTMYSYEC